MAILKSSSCFHFKKKCSCKGNSPSISIEKSTGNLPLCDALYLLIHVVAFQSNNLRVRYHCVSCWNVVHKSSWASDEDTLAGVSSVKIKEP